jgi:hypothetical protein
MQNGKDMTFISVYLWDLDLGETIFKVEPVKGVFLPKSVNVCKCWLLYIYPQHPIAGD